MSSTRRQASGAASFLMPWPSTPFEADVDEAMWEPSEKGAFPAEPDEDDAVASYSYADPQVVVLQVVAQCVGADVVLGGVQGSRIQVDDVPVPVPAARARGHEPVNYDHERLATASCSWMLSRLRTLIEC